MSGQIIFHGGCIGCRTQKKKGVDNCRLCQYFDADWSLPDLSDRPKSKADEIRDQIKEKYGMQPND